MFLSQITVTNFRLLKDITIKLEKDITLIVGRNNSGKTSLTHLLGYVFSDKTPKKLSLYDFSISYIEILKRIGFSSIQFSSQQIDRLSKKFPAISIELLVDYSDNLEDYPAFLQPFIIDLHNPKQTTAKILASYNINIDKFPDFIEAIRELVKQNEMRDKNDHRFINLLADLIPKYYSWDIIAINPDDESDIKILNFSALSKLIKGYFISAQRSLGDYQPSEKDSIGSIIKSLVTKVPEAERSTNALVNELSKRQAELTIISQNEMAKMIPDIVLFGSDYIEDIAVDIKLNIDNFAPHLDMTYAQRECGIRLPEHHNGLGRRNLLLISMKLVEYIKNYKFNDTLTDINLIFIEEPEAYFHPQMQEVFIKTLLSYKKELEDRYLDGNKWPVQFIITTHSSHIANKEDFRKVRYFKAVNKNIVKRKTIIKDLSTFSDENKNKNFLNQYLTLTVCDLFFADKLVLIEGTTERILFPKFIKKFEEKKGERSLSSQYIAILEISGAHAHIFFSLIDFLQIPTLIITDLDSIDPKMKEKNKTCIVSKGKTTSNSCLKNWFKHINELKINKYRPELLILQSESDKIQKYKKIVYQIPERVDFPCGRSFEAALQLANLDLYGIKEADFTKLEEIIWKNTKNITSKKKLQWAFNYAFRLDDWKIPKYIEEGLEWLANQET